MLRPERRPVASWRPVVPPKRAADVLGYFDRPGTSNGPTEAINGRLEHLRGSALGFRNLTNDIARSLLEPAVSDPDYTPDCEEPVNHTGSLTSGCVDRCVALQQGLLIGGLLGGLVLVGVLVLTATDLVRRADVLL